MKVTGYAKVSEIRCPWSVAPVITQDVNAEYDRFGRVYWDKHQVTIDPMWVTCARGGTMPLS